MNNDRISNTPGGERMLFGAIVLGFAFMAWQGLRYELGTFGHWFLVVLMGVGAVQFVRGVIDWKYTSRETFLATKAMENLFVDVPLTGQPADILHAIEDALIELIRNSSSVEIKMQSIDTANNMGTVHMTGRNADAMYMHVFATLSRFTTRDGLHLFPNPGQPIDTEIHGKRLLMDLPGKELNR